MKATITHDLLPDELLHAVIGLVEAEELNEPLLKALGDHDSHREPVPERYMSELMREFSTAGAQLDSIVVSNLDRAARAMLTGAGAPTLAKAAAKANRWLRRKSPNALMLSTAQIQELIDLIRVHYRMVIRVGGTMGAWGAGVPDDTIRKWRAWKLIAPDVDMGGMVRDAFIAGRLAQILEDGATLADMRRMAREFPMPREASLTLQAVQERIGMDLAGGPGYRAEVEAGRLMLNNNAQRVQDIVIAYRRGELRHTPTNRTGLSAEEVEATQTDRAVEGWRGLGRELRNRMRDHDRDRDWDRVAASALRQSKNIGTISALAESGAEYLYYDVHRNACAHCKRLYLEADGTPKLFPVAEIMLNVVTTGGANYDRKASKIGDPESGWLPNALAHPWCQCRPRRVIKGITPQAR